MTKWKEQHLECPKCDSTDAFCIDMEGNGYCFSCEAFVPNSDGSQGDSSVPVTLTPEEKDLKVGGTHRAITERSISKESCEFFDVKITNTEYVFPYKDYEKKLVAQKCRPLQNKEFFWKGSPRKSLLFGQDKFNGGRSVTIVEGEFDVLAYRDLMGDYPVVSVSNGAQSAYKDVKKQLDYFKNFQDVYICFDNDEHGRKAAEKVAELFPIGKVKIVHLRHHKDANDYLKNKDHAKFKKCWWDAVEYTPAGIEAGTEGGFDSLFEEVDDLELFPYPYDKLNEYTFGIRKGEMVTVVAGSGVGKSAFVGEVAYNLLMNTRKKIGMLMLEESPKKTKLRLMSLYLNKPLHLTLLGRVAENFDFLGKVLDRIFNGSDVWKWDPKVKNELKKGWDNVIDRKTDDGDNQLWLFNHFGSNDIDTIVNRIDAMVTGLGCEFIVLDHISMVVSDQQNSDERKALDELATKLRTLVEHRNFALIIVSHLRRPGGKPHEEGGETSLADIRGTAGIGQLSDIVIGLERNGQHKHERLRNVTFMRVLKNRFAGFTGLSSYAEYEAETGRLHEVDAEEIEDIMNDNESGFEFINEDTPVFDQSDSGNRVNAERV